MKSISIEKIGLLLLVLSIILITPNLFRDKIEDGQLEKQVEFAEGIQSYLRGQNVGLFPYRHILEVYHEKPMPWAVEFPIYSSIVVSVSKLTNLNHIIAGRIISFLFFLLLLFAGYKIGALFTDYRNLKIFLPLVLSFMPVFKIYAVSVMPELAMVCFSLWGIYFVLRRNVVACFFIMMAAILFKYYAIFTLFAFLLFILSSSEFNKKFVKIAFMSIAAVPAIVFVIYFIKAGISNPITDFSIFYGKGHISSILNFHNYQKSFLWIFIKNPTMLGTLLMIFGGICLYKTRQKELGLLMACLVVANFIFMVIFSASFAIHDYYGIQFSLISAILAALGLCYIFDKAGRFKLVIISLLLIVFLIYGLIVFRSQTVQQTYYSLATEDIKLNSLKDEKLIVISDFDPHTVLYGSDRTGWCLKTEHMTRFSNLTDELLKSGKASKLVYLLKSPNVETIKNSATFKTLKYTKSYESNISKVPAAHLYIFENDK